MICGGGALPDELGRRFIELAGGDAAKLVIITTASVLADTDRVETKLAFWRRQQLAELAVMHTRSRETANQPEFVKPLEDATGVWFIGGNQNWLTETYLGTLAEREIRGVLERDGVVGGTSAGAAIMSPIMIRRDKPELEEGPGFGFLPGTVVDQHFIKRNRQSRLLRVLDSHPDLVGLGIDEGTALVVEGPNLSVLGESQVMVCSPNVPDQPPQVRPLKAGVQVDLARLRSDALARRPVVEQVAESPASKPAEDNSGVSAAAVSVGPDDRPASSRESNGEDKLGQ
ncbi:MAG TPA: cyanophycinase [Pirellulales bacterium]|nr:cyanophycinase [Pirellulales bacterium]